MINVIWHYKTSPMTVCRILGPSAAMDFIRSMVEPRVTGEKREGVDRIIDFAYQFAMRDGPSEGAIHIMFSPGL